MTERCAGQDGVAETVMQRPIRGVALIVPEQRTSAGYLAKLTPAQMWKLVAEFPAVRWALMDQSPGDAVTILEREWRSVDLDLYTWDRSVGAQTSGSRWLVIVGDGDNHTLTHTAQEILTRYQRLIPRVNTSSSTPVFSRVLIAHRALHDVSLPLVRADYDHALDVWQWLLRLHPSASAAAQMAALFHDIERLVTEAERRIEHTTPDYQALRNAHVESGARLAARVLCACGIEPSVIAEVAFLIRAHHLPHHTSSSRDARLLADADALSFFSLNSPAFMDYHGPAHTARKVAYTLGRMSARAARRLARIRLRDDVASLLGTDVQTAVSLASMGVSA